MRYDCYCLFLRIILTIRFQLIDIYLSENDAGPATWFSKWRGQNTAYFWMLQFFFRNVRYLEKQFLTVFYRYHWKLTLNRVSTLLGLVDSSHHFWQSTMVGLPRKISNFTLSQMLQMAFMRLFDTYSLWYYFSKVICWIGLMRAQ